jgi:hypothetical protein
MKTIKCVLDVDFDDIEYCANDRARKFLRKVEDLGLEDQFMDIFDEETFDEILNCLNSDLGLRMICHWMDIPEKDYLDV